MEIRGSTVKPTRKYEMTYAEVRPALLLSGLIGGKPSYAEVRWPLGWSFTVPVRPSWFNLLVPTRKYGMRIANFTRRTVKPRDYRLFG